MNVNKYDCKITTQMIDEQGASRDYHFDVDFDEVDNDARAGATSPPPQSSNGGVHRTNTVSSNSSGKGNKDRSSMRLASAQTYRPTSVLSTNTGSSGTLVSPSGSPNGKGGKGSSFKIFGGGNKKKSGYEYGLESPTGNGGIDYDNDGYVEDDMDKSLDFEKLIQSGQTMKVTLTPNRLRTIEVKDQPGGKRTTPASSSWSQRAPPIPTKSTSSSSLPPPLPEKRVNFATSSRDEEDDDDDDDLDDEFPMGGRRKGGKEESLFDFLRSTGPEDYGSKPSVGRTTSPTRNGSGPTTPRHVPIVIPQSNINDTNSKLNKLGMGSPTRGTSANMNSVDRPLPPPSSPRSPRSPSQQSPQGEYPPSYLRPAIKRNGSNTNESTNSTNSNSSGRSDSPLRPRPPASAPARGEDEDDDDNDDLDDLLTDGTGGQRRNKRVSYMSETSTLIDFLSSTTPSSPAPAARTPSAATNSPPFNTRPRADSVNGGKKFVKIEIPKVESIEKMLKGQDSPKLPTEYKLPPGYQPVPGSGITGMKVPDEQVETVEKEVAQKEEMVPEIKIEEPEVKQPQPRSKSPIGAPRSGSLAERKVKFEQEAIAGEIDGVKSLRRKMPPTPSHDEKQQSTEPERPSARTRFDPTVNGTVSATNTAVVTAAVVTAEPESLPESEPNPEPLPSETKRERPPSMVAKRASLFNTLATQENITISAKEIHSLRKQLTSANSVEMSVRVWDDFLHKNGGAVMHRRTTLRRANLTESEDEREQQLLQDIAANDAGANSDDGSASGSGRDSAGSERSNTRDSVVMTRARRFENPEEQQNSFEKAERTRAAEAIAAAREKREARRSLIMLANQRPPRPVMVEIAIQTDVVEPEPPEPVVVTAAKVETVSSTEASADSPVTAVAEEKPKSQNPMLVLSAENEDGSVVEQEVELSDVETEEEEKGVVIGDEEWFLDADEEWEDNEADEALVAEWLLGEAVLAF
ncbi:hypothetical protein BC937DRAFT_94493 [Endogone sp. FLAS-F59071]|nr:hypothetical protein BC937DRAFT_94493 [Endogone sp. FLAS-F59071]|eukprot:RUS13997.1 hypothetical protein BC937DRAFT_94493 [Endogone sp. FLAS-F59071]